MDAYNVTIHTTKVEVYHYDCVNRIWPYTLYFIRQMKNCQSLTIWRPLLPYVAIQHPVPDRV